MTLADNGNHVSLPDLLGPGTHGTTFGGTPLGCAVSIETLATIEEENLLTNSAERGRQAISALNSASHPAIATVRGHGLMLGIELDPAATATMPGWQTHPEVPLSRKVTTRCQEAGLLVVPSGTDRIRWLPPLNVTAGEIDRAVEIFLGVLKAAAVH